MSKFEAILQNYCFDYEVTIGTDIDKVATALPLYFTETIYYSYVYPFILVYFEENCKGSYLAIDLEIECSSNFGEADNYANYFYDVDDYFSTGRISYVWTNGKFAYPDTTAPTMAPNSPTLAPAETKNQLLEMTVKQVAVVSFDLCNYITYLSTDRHWLGYLHRNSITISLKIVRHLHSLSPMYCQAFSLRV